MAFKDIHAAMAGNLLGDPSSSSPSPTGGAAAGSAAGAGAYGAASKPFGDISKAFGGMFKRALTKQEIEQRLHEIYTVHNPEKVKDIPDNMKRYEGREQELLRKVMEKYHVK